MTLNAAIKLGLESLRESLDEELNTEAVEIASVTSDGYAKLSADDTKKHIGKLKPLE